MSREDFMRRAIELSWETMKMNAGGPFGAVIVKGDSIIAEGANQVTSANDPTAHAEIVAIRDACRSLGTFLLKGCEIITSCEPCPMCLGAICWAQLDRIWFANTRIQAAAIGFDDEVIYQEILTSPDRRRIPMTRTFVNDAHAVFDAWRIKPDKIPY